MNKIYFILLITFFNVAHAQTSLPRFASLKSDEVNVRTGPNVRYPVKWIFKSKNEPIEIIAEFEQWRKIKDFDNENGWIHSSMLSGRRNAIISSKQNVAFYSSNDVNSIKIAQLEPRVRVKLEKCKKDWCKLTIDKMCGWVERKYIWGIHEQENF